MQVMVKATKTGFYGGRTRTPEDDPFPAAEDVAAKASWMEVVGPVPEAEAEEPKRKARKAKGARTKAKDPGGDGDAPAGEGAGAAD